jgi:L-malate glycosyltransferase
MKIAPFVGGIASNLTFLPQYIHLKKTGLFILISSAPAIVGFRKQSPDHIRRERQYHDSAYDRYEPRKELGMISVLHIDTGTTFRGGQRQVGLLVKHLSKHDIKQYLAIPENSPLVNICNENNILHFPISVSNIKRLIRRNSLRYFIVDNIIDIIHAHDSHAHSLMVSLRFKTKAPKFIVTRRCPNKITFGSRSKYTGHHIRYIAISNRIKSALSKGGVGDDFIFHIPDMIENGNHGIEYDALKRNHIDDGGFQLVSAGAFDSSKSFLAAVKAIEKLSKKRQDFTYTIYGDGDTFENVRNYVHANNLMKFIKLPGWVNNVYDYWKDANIYISPSRSEGLNSSLLEAMALGICPVVTDIQAHRENVNGYDTGLLFPVDDFETLSDQLDLLMSDSDLRKNISRHVREVVAGYDANIITAQVYDLYRLSVKSV